MSSDGIPSLGLPSSLMEAQIASLPDSFYYIADFITEDEEHVLLDKVRFGAIDSSPRHAVTLTIIRLHRLLSRAGKSLDTAACKHGLRI